MQGGDGRIKPELTCISEEGIADMDLPDHLLEELDYLGDCITSCDKVENYLMRSEYENNLIVRPGESNLVPSTERRPSRLKRSFSIRHGSITSATAEEIKEDANSMDQISRVNNGSTVPPSALPTDSVIGFGVGGSNYVKYAPQRHITVIEEASV